MPNYTKTRIKMKGISELPIFSEEDGEKFLDFNKIISMPKELNIEQGTITEDSTMYYLTEKCTIPVECLGAEELKIVKNVCGGLFSDNIKYLNSEFIKIMKYTVKLPNHKKNDLYEKGKTYVNNYKKYDGCVTWYDWRQKNWGTKWNSCSTDIIDKDTVEIQTAWSYPEPIIVKISQMCPDSVVEILWADEDMGYNSGCRFCKDGIFFKGGEYKNCSNESYEAYTSLFKESNCLYKDDKGNWKKRNCEDCSGC